MHFQIFPLANLNYLCYVNHLAGPRRRKGAGWGSAEIAIGTHKLPSRTALSEK